MTAGRLAPRLRITAAARSPFPGLAAHGLAVHGLTGPPSDVAALERLVADRLQTVPLDALATHPRIAPWRDAYRAMGLKPSDYRSSIEQLVRRRLGGRPIETGLWVVDLYNLISLAWLAPMGGYDLADLSGEALMLRMADPERDRFEPLGGDPKTMMLMPRIACYAQGDDILCWALNFRDARRTALKPQSSSALFVSESLDDAGAVASVEALEALATHLSDAGAACGKVERFELD